MVQLTFYQLTSSSAHTKAPEEELQGQDATPTLPPDSAHCKCAPRPSLPFEVKGLGFPRGQCCDVEGQPSTCDPSIPYHHTGWSLGCSVSHPAPYPCTLPMHWEQRMVPVLGSCHPCVSGSWFHPGCCGRVGWKNLSSLSCHFTSQVNK